MGIFDNFNQRVTGLGLPGGLGLLQAGTDMLGGQPIGDAVRSGLQTFQGVTQMDEERKRKALVQDLVSKGGFTPQEQALILASQNPASVAAQIRTQKQAAALAGSKPMSNLGQLGRDLQKGLISQEDYDKAVAKATYTTPPKLSALQEKSALLKDAGILPGSDDFNQALFGIPKDKPTTLQERDSLLKAAGIDPGTDDYRQAMFGITPDKQSAFAEKEAALKTAGFEVGSAEYNQALFNIKDDKPSVFQEKITQLTNENVKVGSPAWNQALYGITPKAPKSASLVNLIAQNDFVIDGRQVKAGEVLAFDQATQQEKIVEAARLGAILAPSKVEQVTSPTVDTSKVDELVSSIASDTSDTSLNLNVGTAAGGDIPGVVTDVLNTVVGAFTGSFSPDRKRQVAVLNEANNTIKVPLVKALNRAGSKFAIEQVDTILPQPSNQNETFIQRFDALKPRLDIAIKQLAADSLNTELTESERIAAKDEAKQLIEYQQNMQSAIDVYRKNRGGTKSETQKKADKILEELK